MKHRSKQILEQLFESLPQLEVCREDIKKAFDVMKACYSKEGKALICGNGGSAADCEHMVSNLMKGFVLKRTISGEDVEKIKAVSPDDWKYLSDNLQGALPAISLVSQSAISTAFINDLTADMLFAQLVYGYGKSGDFLIGFSTSGNSKNVVNAIKIAKALGLQVIGFTGENGGKMKDLCDVTIKVPSSLGFNIQEYHLPVYHALCMMLESEMFDQ